MNVYEKTQHRLKVIFEEFDNAYVSFSGGKDSGVLLNLCVDYIRKNLPGRKLGVFHLDYEAQYTMTTEYVDKALSENQDIIEVYRCCVPFKVTTCTSMYDAFWRPWEEEKKDLWVSKLPKKYYTKEDFPFFKENMWDYEFQELFSSWIHEKKGAKKTCCLVGIRTQESLDRWRAIHSDRNYNKFKDYQWTKKMDTNVYNAYPIFDWTTQDIWVGNAKFNWSYNRLYDLFYKAGLTIDKMRVASPFLSTAQESLKLYRIIEPDTWGKLISRVNGVNFTALYGGTKAMGRKNVKLPEGHTWKSYMEFLLKTLPNKTSDNYKKKVETSIKFWRERGGVLSDETIQELRKENVKFKIVGTTNYKTDKVAVTMEYVDDTNVKEFNDVPSYKRICLAILRNDHLLKSCGFSLTKGEMELRQNATNKYENLKSKISGKKRNWNSRD